MTSRRDFIGLLALAPLAGPVLVNGVVEAQELAVGQTLHYNFTCGLGLVGENCTDFVLSPSQFRAFQDAIPLAAEPNEALRRLMRSTSPWDAPNRLYGASINEDGDAI